MAKCNNLKSWALKVHSNTGNLAVFEGCSLFRPVMPTDEVGN